MPRYGFLLRSQIRDMVVEGVFSETRSEPISEREGKPSANTPPKQHVLVQKRLAPEVIYCLFDAAPPDLRRIRLRMPPRQQRFKIGETLTHAKLTVRWKKLYKTTERPNNAQPDTRLHTQPWIHYLEEDRPLCRNPDESS